MENTLSTDLTIEVSLPVGDKLCRHPKCRKTLVRREGESLKKFNARGYCNRACARSSPERYAVRNPDDWNDRPGNKKICEVCSGDFFRRRNEPKERFDARPTCSRACAHMSHLTEEDLALARDGKVCEFCGEKFFKRPKGETFTKYKARTTCGSTPCSQAKRHRTAGFTSGGKKNQPSSKKKERVKLPEISPLKRDIPEAPTPPPREPWRPDAWKNFRDVRPKISA